MASKIPTLSEICGQRLLQPKWLLAPSLRVANQWIESVVRRGETVVNLHPTTVTRLALDMVAAEVAEKQLKLVGRRDGSLLVEAIWNELDPNGYLGRLTMSTALSTCVFESLWALRMAPLSAAELDPQQFESPDKGEDLRTLLRAYTQLLQAQRLIDQADLLRLAAQRCQSADRPLTSDTVVLVPEQSEQGLTGLEREWLDCLDDPSRIRIRHPVELDDPSSAGGWALGAIVQQSVPANRGGPRTRRGESRPDTIHFFRAVGEANEVREVLRRCLETSVSLDQVELLHTDSEVYVPLLYAMGQRYGNSPGLPAAVPMTFADGISTTESRPGRALAAWLHWIEEGYPQRRLVEMISEGLLQCVDDTELGFQFLARLLRPLAIGQGADHYLPKLDQQIKALEAPPVFAPESEEAEPPEVAEQHRQRKQKGLRQLRKVVAELLQQARTMQAGSSAEQLDAARQFLSSVARSASELDQFAAEALIQQIDQRQVWMQQFDVTLDPFAWLQALPAQTRVLGSGPRPGHLHVASIGSGGHSGRAVTFVVGMDDRRFPGAAQQDPILLDRERSRLSPHLITSGPRLVDRISGLMETLSRLDQVTISWSCLDLADDRETFPSSFVLSAFRATRGPADADLETLNAAVGPPASFATDSELKSLDESDLWLGLLGDESLSSSDCSRIVENRYPHLGRGAEAGRQRATTFGSFSGHVPLAGQDLDPFGNAGRVLSASALETAGRCPLAFFFRSGLGLFPPDELLVDPERWLDAAQMGTLLHEVFRRFMVELSAEDRRPAFDRDHKRLAAILDQVVQDWRQQIPPPNEHAYRTQYWRLIRTARIFLQAEEELCRTSQPRFFEAALGMASETEPGRLDRADPMVVALPDGQTIRARGRIDRIDETGSHQYSVWDYKVGSGYGYEAGNPFREGRRVQSWLYLQMVQAALRDGIDPQAMVTRFGYFFPSIRALGLRTEWDAEALAAGGAMLNRLCQLIAAGAFLATDDHNDCTYCDYMPVCGNVEQLAANSKRLLNQVNIVPLDSMRALRYG